MGRELTTATCFVACLAWLAGCASVPAFKPSRPVAEAPSLAEGLVLCHEYRLPAEPSRPVTLRPFVSCLDELRERFPAEATGSEAYGVFREEFRTLYGLLNDEHWTERLGIELEVAAHAVLRALWQPERPQVSPLERDLVMRNFPSTARRLEARDWSVSSEVGFDPRLESLKAGITGLGAADALSKAEPVVRAEDPSQVSELCRRYLALRREASYLGQLARDERDFVRIAPRDPLSASIRGRYVKRLDVALRELEDLRPKIADSRAKGSFRVLACIRSNHA